MRLRRDNYFKCSFGKEEKYKGILETSYPYLFFLVIGKLLDSAELPSFKDEKSNKWHSIKLSIANPKNVLFIGNIPKDLEEEKVLLYEYWNSYLKRYSTGLFLGRFCTAEFR